MLFGLEKTTGIAPMLSTQTRVIRAAFHLFVTGTLSLRSVIQHQVNRFCKRNVQSAPEAPRKAGRLRSQNTSVESRMNGRSGAKSVCERARRRRLSGPVAELQSTLAAWSWGRCSVRERSERSSTLAIRLSTTS